MTRSRETGDVGYRAYKKNFLINGDMSVWQRGTSFVPTISNTFTADRWAFGTAPNGLAVDRVLSTEDQQYCMSITSQGTNTINMLNRVEGNKPLLGKDVVLTVKLKADVSLTVCKLRILDGDSGAGTRLEQSFTPTGSIQTVTLKGNLASNTSGDDWWLVSILANAQLGDNLIIYEAQLEEGTSATEFEYVSPQEQLAACQRYYWRSTAVQAFPALCMVQRFSSTQMLGVFQLPVTMRAAFDVNFSSPSDFRILGNSVTLTDIQPYTNQTLDSVSIDVTVSATIPSGEFSAICTYASSSAWVEVDAEL